MNKRLSYPLHKLIGIYVAWWIFLASVQTLVLHRLQLNWHIAVLDSSISSAILAIVGFSAMLMYRFYQPGINNRIYRGAFALVISAIYCFALQHVLAYIFTDDEAYLLFLEKSIPVRFIFALLIISFITLLNWLWSTLSEQKEIEKRKIENEQLAKETELAKLRQQLQPHFLFNSLNSISALVLSKPQEARDMIHQLSDFLRGTLKKDNQSVTLSEELEHLKLYLAIEKVRFGHRLNINFDIQNDALGCIMPTLLLQPVVENAIKFGLYDIAGEVTITVSCKLTNSLLVIEITNPFDPQTKKAVEGTGFGLNSIQRRLYLLYARQDLIATAKDENTFITTLKIPQ